MDSAFQAPSTGADADARQRALSDTLASVLRTLVRLALAQGLRLAELQQRVARCYAVARAAPGGEPASPDAADELLESPVTRYWVTVMWGTGCCRAHLASLVDDEAPPPEQRERLRALLAAHDAQFPHLARTAPPASR